MKLWSFQSLPVVARLEKRGMIRGDWDFISGDKWKLAYCWMMQEMEKRGIPCNGFAPIWAWHSCEYYGRGPDMGTAIALLSEYEREAGIKIIEFECPPELVLLSRYGPWNDVFYQFIDGKEDVSLSPREYRKLFRIIHKGQQEYQATLPYLKLEWVKDIRDLPFVSLEEEYDWATLV